MERQIDEGDFEEKEEFVYVPTVGSEQYDADPLHVNA